MAREPAGPAPVSPDRGRTRGGWLAALSARCAEDFRLALMLSIGAVAMLVVSAFAVYRFGSGNIAGGALNVVIVLALGGVLLWALRGASTRLAASAFIAVATLAAIASAYVFGRTGLYWTFLVLWLSFVLAPPRLAMLANLALLLAVLIGNRALFGSSTEWAAYLATGGLVTWVAWLASTRLERQRLALQLLADEDPLTGAGNRRSLQRDLERQRAAHRGGVLAVLDIDWFKQVNDEHGHAAGDRVLVGLVELLGQRLRRVDGVYRIGGEEFVLLLPATPPAALPIVLERLQDSLRSHLRSPGGPVTVSIGAAALHADEAWNEWLARADAALYRAKHAGRDRTEIDHDPQAHTGSVEVMAERRLRRS